jgi:hypothetical protein
LGYEIRDSCRRLINRQLFGEAEAFQDICSGWEWHPSSRVGRDLQAAT